MLSLIYQVCKGVLKGLGHRSDGWKPSDRNSVRRFFYRQTDIIEDAIESPSDSFFYRQTDISEDQDYRSDG